MGTSHSSSVDSNHEVGFDDFQILRAIGKGSFGKVCIVQKKDTRKMYAMKYMNKSICIKKDAVRNVFREIELLKRLDHPFLVNLWFTFQDEEDMFMVVTLLLGGDLRYHLQENVKFDQTNVKLYICEMALALEYLRSERIVHRDIKPDNILLDEAGHLYLTDFNVATILDNGQLATSMSGTKPYMAPEVFNNPSEECPGYSFPVDWWSLGTCAYEMLRGKRPYDIHAESSMTDVRQQFLSMSIQYPAAWHEGMRDLLKQLLDLKPGRRLSSLDELKRHHYMADVDFDCVLRHEIKPTFVPAKDHLNCDPTYELEEMIIEAKPLHKKKKRLAKQNSRRDKDNVNTLPQVSDPLQICMENIEKEFRPYNRERAAKELERSQSLLSPQQQPQQQEQQIIAPAKQLTELPQESSHETTET